MYDTRNRRAKIQNLLCMILCISLLACPLRVYATDAGEGQAAEVSWPQGPAITAEAGVVMEVSTGAVLYEQNMHAVHYPAKNGRGAEPADFHRFQRRPDCRYGGL